MTTTTAHAAGNTTPSNTGQHPGHDRFYVRQYIATVYQTWRVPAGIDLPDDETDLDMAILDQGELLDDYYEPLEDWQLILTAHDTDPRSWPANGTGHQPTVGDSGGITHTKEACMIRIDSPRLVAGGRGAETYTYSTLTAALGELNEIAHGRDGSPYIWRAAADSHEPRELPAGLPADQPALWEKDGQLVTTDPLRALLALANAELDDPNITITIDHTRRYTRVPGDRWQYGDDTERRWSIHDPVPIFARV